MLDSKKAVRTALLKKLALSGLDKNDGRHSGFLALSARALIRRYPNLTKAVGAGFVIPYYGVDGKRTDFYRYRYLEDPKRVGFAALTEHKTFRYIQPAAKPPRVYFSPLHPTWEEYLSRPAEKRPLFITEGELKAACAVKNCIPTIGLGGVWNFRVKEKGLLPELEAIDWKDVFAYIVYDSDALSNPQVIKAENTLAEELLARGARVTIVRLPSLGVDEKTGKALKTGLDDFLMAKGPEAFFKLVEKMDDWDASKVLHRLNELVTFVRDPGILLRLDTQQRMSVNSFENIFANHIITTYQTNANGRTKIEKKPAPKEFIKWPHRAEVERLIYAPGKPRVTEMKEYNLWRGWGLKDSVVKPGSLRLWKELIDFLFEGERDYFERWLAYPLQHPGEKLYTAVVLWGLEQGTGKSLVGYTMERIYGVNFVEIKDEDLMGSFNEWAANKQFAMGDEITGGDKRMSADRMKSLITRKFARINEKYVPSYVIPDCVNYYFTSNHPDSFFLEDNDRRYFIQEVKGKPLSPLFYAEYDRWYKSDDVGALFYHLLSLDLDAFDPTAAAPQTTAKKEMLDMGRSELGAWVAKLRDTPDAVLKMGNSKPIGRALWTTSELLAVFNSHNGNGGASRVTAPGMGRELKRAGFNRVLNGDNVRTNVAGVQRLWAIRDCEELLHIRDHSTISEMYDQQFPEQLKMKERDDKLRNSVEPK